MTGTTPRPNWFVRSPLAVGIAYFLLAALALIYTRFSEGVALISCANALLMAVLLSCKPARWTPIIIASAIGNMIATTFFGMGALAALPMALINMGEALVVALLCRRFAPGRVVAGSLRPLLVFIAALAGVANLVGATAAAALASALTPSSFGASWLQWYSGHVLGGLILTPILIMLLQGEVGRWFRKASPAARWEAVALLATFALVSAYVFREEHYPLLFVPLLPLVMIAFRGGHLGAAAAIVLLALIGGFSTLTGHGPLHYLPGSHVAQVGFFQFYLAMSFLISMPVAAELNGRRRLFRLLQQSESRFRVLAEHSGDLVLNLDLNGTILYASPVATEQIGVAPDDLVGQPGLNLVHPRDRAAMVAMQERALAHPHAIHKAEFRPQVSMRTLHWCEMVLRAVVDEQGVPTGVVATVRDVSRHKARQRALQQVAARDSLTGADSRRAFLPKLAAAASRAGEGVPKDGCLLLIDIDYFKTINDRYGHGVGDRVLTGFVERLRAGLRASDSIGRLGGEEFALLLPGTDLGEASRLCERLRVSVAEPMEVGASEPIALTFSAGLTALWPADPAALLEAADKALYEAKHSGRNCLRLAA